MLEAPDRDTNMRKYAVPTIVVLALLLAGTLLFAVQSSRRSTNLEARIADLESDRAELQRERADLQTRLRPFETKQAAAARITQEFVVPAGMIQSFSFSPSVVPGTLSGSWRSSGAGFGGADDTIAAFRLTDPKDAVLESSPRGSSGSFLVKLSAQGTYQFFFDNSGLFRSTPRRVFLQTDFKAD